MPSLPFVKLLCAVVIILALSTVANRASAVVDPALTGDNSSKVSVHLEDGSVIRGDITGIRNDRLALRTDFAANEILIDTRRIAQLAWDRQTRLMLDDGEVVTLPALRIADGKVDLGSVQRPVIDIDVMDPAAWEQGSGYHWTGNSSAALAYNRGNTQTDEFDVAINTVVKGREDRYTVNAKFEQDYAYRLVESEVDGEIRQVRRKNQTADNWKVLAKYDYFFQNPKNYIGANANIEANALAGIDQRLYVGPYLGRRLSNSNDLVLDGELGAAWVSTDYSTDVDREDKDYVGLNWNLTGESQVLGGDMKLYLNHVGLMDVEDADQLILKNTLGLSFPLLYGLEAAAEVSLNYDGTAAEEREDLDQVYKFRIGYTW